MTQKDLKFFFLCYPFCISLTFQGFWHQNLCFIPVLVSDETSQVLHIHSFSELQTTFYSKKSMWVMLCFQRWRVPPVSPADVGSWLSLFSFAHCHHLVVLTLQPRRYFGRNWAREDTTGEIRFTKHSNYYLQGLTISHTIMLVRQF